MKNTTKKDNLDTVELKPDMFQVLQPFPDPYSREGYSVGRKLSILELTKAGWGSTDIKAAVSTRLLRRVENG